MTARPLAVLFDLDGTLIDSIELILNSARHAFRDRTGHRPDDAEWTSLIGMPLEASFRRYATDDGDIAALLARYREYQMEHHDRLVRCYDEVVETVDFIRAAGHPVAIVTSKTTTMTKRGLDVSGLARHFDTIIGCDVCDRHKPDPQPVQIALERLGYSPGEAVFVGDSVYDMLAGNAAGVTTIAALWGPFTREDLAASEPRHYLRQIRDLPRLLAELQTLRNKESAGSLLR
jgi:pyrophosphatase PpaX